MPITRSVTASKKNVKSEHKDENPKDMDSAPATKAIQGSAAPITVGTPLSTPAPRTAGKSRSSRMSVQRAEALERLAKAKLEEARAATALAEAELAQIDAESERDLESVAGAADTASNEKINEWLDANPSPHHTEMPQTQLINLSTLTAAMTEVAKAFRSPKLLQELPYFNGASSQWLLFKAAYRETCHQFSKTENLARLRKCLKGVAREAVISLFLAETDPEEVLRLLEIRFGRPDSLVIAEMNKMKSLPRLTDNPSQICIFSSQVINIVATVQSLKKDYYLYCPETVRCIVEKMTPAIKYRWYDFASSRAEEEPDLVKLSAFFSREAELCSRYAQAENISTDVHNKKYQTCVSTGKVKTFREDQCVICNKSHKTKDCDEFISLDAEDRWKKAKEVNLCFRCLGKRSYRHRCAYKPCGAEGCRSSHHSLLHFIPNKEKPAEIPEETSEVTATTHQRVGKTLLKIVQVKLQGPTATFETFALLDEGSTISLLEEEVARKIGAIGPLEPLDIEGVGGVKISASNSRRVSFSINGVHSKNKHKIEARTIENLNLAHQSVRKDTVNKCKHLIDISEDIIYDKGTPTLLIGQDNWHLIVSKEIRSGNREDPVASLTELGWVLHGPTKVVGKVNFLNLSKKDSAGEEENEEIEKKMENLIKQFMDLDSLGILLKRPKDDPEERALMLLKKHSRRLPDGCFETGLLWRRDELELPENKNNTLKRLENLEKKLDKDVNLKEKYNKQITHLLDCGYAEEAPPSSCPGRTWYLPHFPVINPSKPKPRIVLDAAAKTKGISLNDMLLTGPDLLQSLPGVLMRFRQKPVAVAGDIREMFLQIKIKKEDRDVLRFLWRQDKEGKKELKEYRMTSLIFGAASSPCTAIFIKNLNAEQHQNEYAEAADAIKRNHYMDDYLQSFKTAEEAIKIASEVSYVHKQAKFNLKGWASNIPEVVEAIEPQQRFQEEEVKLQDSPVNNLEKTLGLVWRTVDDKLTFNLDVKKGSPYNFEEQKQPTKREFLKIIMSLFDPLGLITPISLPARGILQETWRLGILWDNVLPEELYKKWLIWLSHVNNLKNLYLPRCYPGCSSAKFLEMHVFVDASETAYAAAVYWRAIMEDDTIRMSLVMAKGRVAPLKLTSIPRLELQAAVLGCRLAQTVEVEHDLKAKRRIFWTDSKTVLTWLRSGPRVFKPFVAHRVAEIEEESKVNEWRWVPTAHNVADDATRDVPRNFNSAHRWFAGPNFLYSPEEEWPKEDIEEVEHTGEERVTAVQNLSKANLRDALPEASRFSSWTRLIRSTGRVLQFIELCRQKHTTSHTTTVTLKRTSQKSTEDCTWKPATTRRLIPTHKRKPTIEKKREEGEKNLISLEAHYIKKAEILWWKATQEEKFEEDLLRLRNNLPVEKSSRLRTLSLLIDKEGIIRLKSRIESAPDLPEEQRFPPILDGDSYYVRLYITWMHKINHHSGIETIANEVRTRLWVLRLKPTIRYIIKNCIRCRILRGRPALPSTGDHPGTRLGHHQRPFTFVGLDYFGPCGVAVARRHEKRYVALFTCLTTRAVHLELAGSLTTDSAIMALRRMMARRGCPTEIHSDNGTNFRGADAELRRAAHRATKEEAETRAIRWYYVPPGAPFMGGAWERMVQSVKRALAAALNERYPTEEVLHTLLLEAEYTVNNRPLTPVSTSPDDFEALTPLHFILGGPARVPQPGCFVDSDFNSKLRWRQTQRLADLFWCRWLKEYIPLLQLRREPRSRGDLPKVGDLVLLVDETVPRNSWPKGRVVATYPGRDGVVRVVDVQTKAGPLRRPTKKVIVLAEEGA